MPLNSRLPNVPKFIRRFERALLDRLVSIYHCISAMRTYEVLFRSLFYCFIIQSNPTLPLLLKLVTLQFQLDLNS
jgi:hypothetical protein